MLKMLLQLVEISNVNKLTIIGKFLFKSDNINKKNVKWLYNIMSVNTTDSFFIPAIMSYSKIEPAYSGCSDDIIPVAWGARSRVIGNCMLYRGEVGQCLGAFKSEDVDTRDTPWSCIVNDNIVENVCGYGPSTNKNSNNPSSNSSQPSNSSNTSNSAKSSKSQPASSVFSGKVPPNYAEVNEEFPTANDAYGNPFANAYGNPFANGPNPYMSYDVYDKPFLSRGVQSNSDPAGYLAGIFSPNYRQTAQETSPVPNQSWGPCSSYGSYGSCSNCTLSSNTCIGNCQLGQYAVPPKPQVPIKAKYT